MSVANHQLDPEYAAIIECRKCGSDMCEGGECEECGYVDVAPEPPDEYEDWFWGRD